MSASRIYYSVFKVLKKNEGVKIRLTNELVKDDLRKINDKLPSVIDKLKRTGKLFDISTDIWRYVFYPHYYKSKIQEVQDAQC